MDLHPKLSFIPCQYQLFFRHDYIMLCNLVLTAVSVLPGSRSCLVPKNHTEVYISYKLIGPLVQASYLLILTSYISPLFLSELATWLGTFFGEAVTSSSVAPSRLQNELYSSQNSPVLIALPLLPAWLLANQRFTRYKLSHSNLALNSHPPASVS